MKRFLIVALFILLLPMSGHGVQYNIPFSPRASGGAGTNFLADADCIGVYLMTSLGTQAGHENNACTQVVNPAPDVAWQGTGANWTNATPAGTASGQDAVDIDRTGGTGDEYFKGEGSGGEFDMMGSTTLTWMCWVRLNESSNNKTFLSRQGTVNFAMKQSFDEARILVANTTVDSTALDQPLNEWHHWLGVYDSADTGVEIELWVDGLSEATGNQATTPTTVNIDLGIAASHAGAGNFEGQLMECGVFDRAFTDTEICEVLLCGLAGDATPDGPSGRDTNFGATGCTCADITTCC